MEPDWERIRSEFPALEHWTYLNTATYGQTPRRAVAAVQRHFERRDQFACADFLGWFDDADEIRRRLAALIRCHPEDIAFFPTAASALSLLLGGQDWRPGDRVVTLKDEFPNNLYYPALLACAGVEFVETEWSGFYEAITPDTRLVALSSVNYISGFRPPLEDVSRFLRQREVPLFVDGTQSVGALRMDVAAIQPVMMAVDAYKWLLAPNGAAFAFVHPDLRARLRPSVIGWRSHHDWRSVDHLHHGAPKFAETAEKYEGGMLAFPSLYGLGASAGMILEIGPETVERRVQDLVARLRELLRGLGAELLFDQAPYYDSPIVAARFAGKDATILARDLRRQRVLVSARHGNLRVSVHFYNNEHDLLRLEAELKALLRC